MNLNEFLNGRFPDILDGNRRNWSGDTTIAFNGRELKGKWPDAYFTIWMSKIVPNHISIFIPYFQSLPCRVGIIISPKLTNMEAEAPTCSVICPGSDISKVGRARIQTGSRMPTPNHLCFGIFLDSVRGFGEG